MRIDATRYSMFWNCPDRYRLRECWKLSPIEPKADSFAGLLTFGRRRGTAFHELRDGAYNGIPEEQTLSKLKEMGLGDNAIKAALRMAAVVCDRYPNPQYLAHEQVFEYPIPDSPHVLTGRVDNIFERDGEVLIGDYKTTKHRTKADYASLVAKYVGSPQVDFYLLGARSLGYEIRRFFYFVVSDGPSGKSPRIPVVREHVATRTSIGLRQFERSVHLTCNLIEFLKSNFGTENPWPVLWEPFDRGYSTMLGQKMYSGFMPDGFQTKVEHLSTMEDEAEGEDA